MSLPIPEPVIYAGLAGCVIALIVATAQQKWSCRAFFILVLRLAIGWHFLFEGLHKLHSFEVGETETSKPFSSSMYFNAAEGPLGPLMRKQFLGDPDKEIQNRILLTQYITPQNFRKLSDEEQAKNCPPAVAKEIDDAQVDAAKAMTAKAKYARWVYGVDRRDAKARLISSDVPQSAQDRLEHIRIMMENIQEYEARQKFDLGNGNGVELKRTASTKADLRAAKTALVDDSVSFVDELKKEAGWKSEPVDPNAPKPEKVLKPIEKLDRVTGWSITLLGAFILFGFLTRTACVLAAGFLVMTYLSHPTVPWLPLPPMTEGNPVFINKNLIECFALMVVASYPTGRWLGLDALIHYVCCGKKVKAEASI